MFAMTWWNSSGSCLSALFVILSAPGAPGCVLYCRLDGFVELGLVRWNERLLELICERVGYLTRGRDQLLLNLE